MADDALSSALLRWLEGRHQAVLVTTRADGSPQSSNVAFAFDGTTAYVSVTDGRAKTRNLRRDPRAVLHVLGDTFWQYAAVRVDAVVGAVSTEPGDQAGQDLLALYETVSGKPHPDPAEFLQAMVDDRRLRLELTPVSAVGSGLPGA